MAAEPTLGAAAARRPGLRLLLAHPAHLIALGLGSGLLRPGPGTWGTALAWLLYALFAALHPGTGLSFALLALSLPLGVWAAGRAGAALGEADAAAIVIDEMVAFWLVLLMLPTGASFGLQAAAFLLFRLFDITKPPPIRQIDRRWHHPLGVMADDLLAAFYTLLVIAAWMRLS